MEGIGEDVTYDAEDHEILQQAGPVQPLAGRFTIASFCEHVEGLDLFPVAPQREVSVRYRRWAYQSAALDLALRQAGQTLHGALDRTPRPVRFVVSLRLGEPPTLEPIRKRLDAYPGLRFKLDPTSSWDERLISELVETGAVDSVDFKALYVGSIVDQPADPVLYRRVVEAFPDAWIEDPGLTPETDEILAAAQGTLLLGRQHPLDRRHRVASLQARDGQHQALAPGRPAEPPRRLRLLRRARNRELRRRAVRARRGTRSEPVPRLAVPCRRPQRRRADAAST